LRARLLAVEIRILSSNPTPLARTEALHVLATWPETRDLVINDLVDRLLGRAEGYVDTIILSKAFATHFDRLIDAFEQKLMRNPSSYDYHELSALADYIPATDAEAERILGLFERLWDAGPGEPITTIAENLLKFSARVQSTRDRAVTLAFRIAQSSGSRHAYGPLAQAAIDNRDPGFRQQIFEVFTESDDPKMKEALISELVREVGGFADPDETLYEAVLRAAATGLEANEIGLVFAAQRSREFALALARVIRHTTPKPGGLLATFADQTTSQPDPQSAARRAIELHRKKRD